MWKLILLRIKSLPPVKIISYTLLLLATVVIFILSEVIRLFLASYELDAMFISFCAGFILFIPLVSLALHPIFFSKESGHDKINASAFLGNIGLVVVVQVLCFLIWMTDAIALYSIYVDQNSFLAKAFNISAEARLDLSVEFFWFNLILAWFFSLLSLVIGVLPCLISRIEHTTVVGNFVSAFAFAKHHKQQLFFYSVICVLSIVLPLLYFPYLFLVLFPFALLKIFSEFNHYYPIYISRK